MLKTIFLISVLAVLFLSGSALAAEQLSLPASVYSPTQIYSGIYTPDRIYYFDRADDVWYADRVFKTLAAIKCPEALQDLGTLGVWSGALKSQGVCAVPDEVIRRATGNYLNFMIEQADRQVPAQ
jgi:hypothetical protein